MTAQLERLLLAVVAQVTIGITCFQELQDIWTIRVSQETPSETSSTFVLAVGKAFCPNSWQTRQSVRDSG